MFGLSAAGSRKPQTSRKHDKQGEEETHQGDSEWMATVVYWLAHAGRSRSSARHAQIDSHVSTRQANHCTVLAQRYIR